MAAVNICQPAHMTTYYVRFVNETMNFFFQFLQIKCKKNFWAIILSVLIRFSVMVGDVHLYTNTYVCMEGCNFSLSIKCHQHSHFTSNKLHRVTFHNCSVNRFEEKITIFSFLLLSRDPCIFSKRVWGYEPQSLTLQLPNKGTNILKCICSTLYT